MRVYGQTYARKSGAVLLRPVPAKWCYFTPALTKINCRAVIERLNEEFRRRVKTRTVLPCAETVPMLLWALMASGQLSMRKVDASRAFPECPASARR